MDVEVHQERPGERFDIVPVLGEQGGDPAREAGLAAVAGRAVTEIAAVLGVSRSSIYHYLTPREPPPDS